MWRRVSQSLPLFLTVSLVAADAPFRLTADVGGHYATVTEVRTNRLICRDGEQDAILDLHRAFRLEGDPLTAAGYFCWPRRYMLVHPTVADALATGSSPWFGCLRISNELPMEAIPPPFWFHDHWPALDGRPGLLLIGWFVDGKVVQIHAEPLVPAQSKTLDLQHFFTLSAAEARGRPFILFWSGKGFVSPAPAMDDKPADVALAAMMLGDLAPLRQLLDAKPSAKRRAQLMRYAADAGLLPAVNLLVKAGTPVATFEVSPLPLIPAAMHGRTEVTNLVAKNGIPPELLAVVAGSAVVFGHEETALSLLTQAGKFKAEDNVNLLKTALYAGHLRLVQAMVERGATLDYSTAYAQGILVDEVRLGRVGVATWLLEQNVDPNATFGGTTALVAAARRGDPVMVDRLLRFGARVNDPDGAGATALQAACFSGHPQIVQILLSAGADPKRADARGRTALHGAVAWNDAVLVDRLVAAGADVNAVSVNNVGALELALRNGFAAAARQLAAKGARLDPQASNREQLVEDALTLDVPEIVRGVLQEEWFAGRVLRGWPALAIAEACSARECATLLSEAGQSISSTTPTIASARSMSVRPAVAYALAPEDPREARGNLPAVTVKVDLVVDTDGTVRFPRVQPETDPRLAAATLTAIRHWKFKPGLIGERPAPTRVTMPVVFTPDLSRAVDTLQLDSSPMIINFTDSVSSNLTDLFSSGMELVIGLHGEVEKVEFRGRVAPEVAAQATKELEFSGFTPGISGGRIVRTHMGMPAIFLED
jgi:TonB family protein